jgi:hypothetical protein
MKVHFAYERILVEDTGGAFRREPEGDYFQIIFTFASGDEIVCLDVLTGDQADDVITNLALASLHQSPYVLIESETEDGQSLDEIVFLIGKLNDEQPDE